MVPLKILVQGRVLGLLNMARADGSMVIETEMIGGVVVFTPKKSQVLCAQFC